jgi:hypothetical protein
MQRSGRDAMQADGSGQQAGPRRVMGEQTRADPTLHHQHRSINRDRDRTTRRCIAGADGDDGDDVTKINNLRPVILMDVLG